MVRIDLDTVVYWSFVFFFFKQKTAYEMRISDWSSDVCSSDLLGLGQFDKSRGPVAQHEAIRGELRAQPVDIGLAHGRIGAEHADDPRLRHRGRRLDRRHRSDDRQVQRAPDRRSDEHTSELQSLMRISYAVFCWKKKTLLYKQ